MRIVSACIVTALLAGCQTTQQPSVVSQVVQQRNVAVPPVEPPPPFKPASFQFQRPEAPNGVVALDVKNYAQFREFMLGINKRELDWQNKLQQANSSIHLLQGITETTTGETQ